MTSHVSRRPVVRRLPHYCHAKSVRHPMSQWNERIIAAEHRAKRQREVEAFLRGSLTAGEWWRWHTLSSGLSRARHTDAPFTDRADTA